MKTAETNLDNALRLADGAANLIHASASANLASSTGEALKDVVNNMLARSKQLLATDYYPVRTLEEDFDHFLSYSGLASEPVEVIAKIKIAYADQWTPTLIAKASAAGAVAC